MRPVTLEIEGFGAFRDRTVVDLSDADLFAIVGATGHGKSTLIDAICFSLYGKVPRYGERDIAPAITLGTNEAKVSLTFDLGRERYVATRVLRRKPDGNGAATRGLRLERLDDTGNEIVAGSAREFEAKINELIGRLRWLAGMGINTVYGAVPHIEGIAPLEVIGREVIPAVADA